MALTLANFNLRYTIDCDTPLAKLYDESYEELSVSLVCQWIETRVSLIPWDSLDVTRRKVIESEKLL